MASNNTNTSTNGRARNAKRAIDQSSSVGDTPIAKRAKSQQSLAPQRNRDSPPSSDSLSSAQEDEPQKVKEEEEEDELVADSCDSEDDDDQPIANLNHKLPPAPKRSIDESSASTTLTTNTEDPKLKTAKKVKAPAVKPEPSSDDDQPLVVRKSNPPKPTKKNQLKVKKEDSDSEDSKPLIQTAPSKLHKKSKATASKQPKLEPDVDKKSKPKRGKSTANGGAAKKESPSQAEIEEEEMYKWWEENNDNNDDDDSKKWTTLQHNGVLFPPEYEPLPSHVKMKYKGKPVDLPPESEEVAYFFGSMLNSDHVQKKVFCDNFFKDFLLILEKYPPLDGTEITEYSHCDFNPIFNYVEAEREKKKSLSSEEKKRLRAEKDLAEAKYKTCLLDGRVEKVGNFRVEPPGLFRGRGSHPKTGRLKKRVFPEDITINCSADSTIPEPPPGHKWGKVVHEEKASWLAFWKESINGNTKYVFLAAGSSLKGQSDMKKYEKARQLKNHIDRIRADYQVDLKHKEMFIRQRATAMYLIDRFALRAGNEKGEDEAETFGCCSLKCDHVTLQPPNTLTFDFLGKDSIRFYNSFQVEEIVFKNIRIFKKGKDGDDELFDRINTLSLNKHLHDNCMTGLTAKVFRTYNASSTFERELKKNMDNLPEDSSLAMKMLAYNRANRAVALLCNHQKTVSKGHESAVEKAIDRIRGFKYQRRRVRWTLLKHPELDGDTKIQWQKDDESDLEDDWIEDHELALEQKKKEAILKKYKRLQEEDEIERNKPESERQAAEEEKKPKVKEEEGEKKPKVKAEDIKPKTEDEKKPKVKEEDDKKPQKKPRSIPPASVREQEKNNELAKIEGFAEVLKGEREQKCIQGDKRSVAQLVKAIQAYDTSIFNAKSSLVDKDENKETALGTSKTNYIDPRISFAWAAKYGVDIKKIFTKTLQEKFTWAKTTDPEWKF